MAKTGFSYRNRKKALWTTLITILVLAALGTLVYFAVSRGAGLFRLRADRKGDAKTLTELWNEGRYAEVLSITEEILATDPMDRDALLLAGYSRFFLAISRLSTEERNADLDASIRHLRLLKARGDTPNPERVDYVLGKAYLLKGVFWADLALGYLMDSLEAGYQSDDSYEFIGRAYSALGDLENAHQWYEKAAENHPTDQLLITLGEEAFNLGLYDDAVRYYLRAIEGTKDDSLKKRGLSQLGQLYYDVGNYAMAREVLENLVSMEPGNQDYQFLLGETYHQLGMKQEARKAWFAVTRINPRHVGALHRLYD